MSHSRSQRKWKNRKAHSSKKREIENEKEKKTVTKDKTGLSEILFAIRMNPSATRKSPSERYTGKEQNLIKK